MYFLTNRFPLQGIQTKTDRQFDFDLDNNAPSNSIYFCQRKGKKKYIEIGGTKFMEALKSSQYRQLLLFIHGYSNLPEDVFDSARELQRLSNKAKQKEILVVPVVWPCDNDVGIVKDYWDDQKAADHSAMSLARGLQMFMKWQMKNDEAGTPCLKRINILAHSMGNRVLRETLWAWNNYDLLNGVPLLFRNTFLAAADIVNESLHRGRSGELICNASRNVVVYYASDDLALRASKAANLKNKIASKRLGHTGPENMSLTPDNVYVADCDDFNTVYDSPKGHSYYKANSRGTAGLLFRHMYGCMETGRVFPDDPERRTIILK